MTSKIDRTSSIVGFACAAVIFTAFFCGTIWVFYSEPPLPSEEANGDALPIIEDDPIIEENPINDTITIINDTEDEIMEIGQFTAVSGTNDDLEDLVNNRNIGYCDSKSWWSEATVDALFIKSAPTITGSSTTEHTYNTSYGANTLTLLNTFARTQGVYVMAGAAYIETKPDTTERFVVYISYSSDSGASFSDRLVVTFYEVSGYSDKYALIDFFVQNTSMFAVFSSGEFVFKNLVTGSNYNAANSDCGLEKYYGGSIQPDGTYEFVFYDDTNARYEKWICPNPVNNIADHTEVLTDISTPIGWNGDVQQYWKQGNLEIIMDEDHLYTRLNGGDWRSESDTGTTTNGIVWGYDADGKLIIKFIIWKDSIYLVPENGYLIKIQTYTGAAYVGWEDWFANGADTIYQFVPSTTKDGTEIYIHPSSFWEYRYPSYPKGVLRTPIPDLFTEGDGVIIYDDRENKLGIAICDAIPRNPKDGLFSIELFSPARRDWERELDSTFNYTVATDVPDMIADILAFCQYIGTGTISTTPATNYTLNLQGLTVGAALMYLDSIENYRHRIDENVLLQWDNGETHATLDYKSNKRGVVDWGTASTPDLSAWTNVGQDIFEVASSLDGHKNPVHINGDVNDYVYLPLNATQTTGTFEFWMYKISASTNEIYIGSSVSNPLLGICEVFFRDDYKIDFEGATSDVDIISYTLGTWIHVKVIFIKNSTCTLTVNGTLISTITGRNTDGIYCVYRNRINNGQNYYIDAIGFSWDGYVSGTNQYAGAIAGSDVVGPVEEIGYIGRPKSVTVTGAIVNGTVIEQTAEASDVGTNDWKLKYTIVKNNTDALAIATTLLADLDADIKRYKSFVIDKRIVMNQQIHLLSLEPALAATLITVEYWRYTARFQWLFEGTTIVYPWAPKERNPQTNYTQIQQAVKDINPSKITLVESSDPSDPANTYAVMWVDSNGDLKIKITHGSVTKSTIIVDYSAL